MAEPHTDGDERRPFLHRWQYVIVLVGIVLATAVGAFQFVASGDDDKDDTGAAADASVSASSREEDEDNPSSTRRSTTTTSEALEDPSSTRRSTTTTSEALEDPYAPLDGFNADGTALPEIMAGTWEGMVQQESPQTIFSAHLELRVATPGRVDVGAIALSTLGCSGSMVLKDVERQFVLVEVTIDNDPDRKCVGGTVKLTYVGPNELTYTYGDNAVGTLTRR